MQYIIPLKFKLAAGFLISCHPAKKAAASKIHFRPHENTRMHECTRMRIYKNQIMFLVRQSLCAHKTECMSVCACAC